MTTARESKRKTRKAARYFFLACFTFALIAGYFANQFVKKKGYKNLWDFITTTGSNYSKSFSAKYEEIDIKIAEDDFRKLEQLREQALRRGIIVNNEDGKYVRAEIFYKGKKTKCEVRLKGHMTDHLQEKKWSFRVKTRKGDALMGMKRFTLQHPGTRNYIHEWIYHQMMEDQGIITLRYMFLKVKVNGEDWGIYALEEHFSQELVQHNERLEGPIIRYNPDLYWAYRINEKNKIRVVEEYARMQSSNIIPYDDKNTLGDSSLRESFLSAVNLMEAWRRNEKKTSEVFDIEKLARFHAVIDIVGGHHSLDWSDVKYYYNPATQVLEPVAYESFGAQPSARISGTFKFVADSLVDLNDHHELLFSDKEFFETYVRELKQLAKKEFLDKFFKKINTDLQNNLAVLFKEYPYKKLDTKIYYDNCKRIRRILDSPQGFYAHFDFRSDTSIHLSIGSVESLPFEITGIRADTTRYLLNQTIIIPSKKSASPVAYRPFVFTFNQKVQAFDAKTKLTVLYRLPGDNKIKEQEVFFYPSVSTGNSSYMLQKQNISEFDFVEENESGYVIVPGKHIIDKDMVLGTGKKLLVTEGTELILNNHAKIISRSPVFFKGTDESPVIVTSADSTGGGIIISNVKERSEFHHVVFQSLNSPANSGSGHTGALNIYESRVSVNNCTFSLSSNDALFAGRSEVLISKALFKMTGQNAVNLNFCKGDVSDIIIEKSKKHGMVMAGSYVRIHSLIAQKIKGSAVFAKEFSEVQLSKSRISSSSIAVEAKDKSTITINNLSLEENELEFKSHKQGDVFGPSAIRVKNLREKNNKKQRLTEKNSEITIQ